MRAAAKPHFSSIQRNTTPRNIISSPTPTIRKEKKYVAISNGLSVPIPVILYTPRQSIKITVPTKNRIPTRKPFEVSLNDIRKGISCAGRFSNHLTKRAYTAIIPAAVAITAPHLRTV